MTGFEPRNSGIGSNHSTDWATTTAQSPLFLTLLLINILNLLHFWVHKLGYLRCILLLFGNLIFYALSSVENCNARWLLLNACGDELNLKPNYNIREGAEL